MGNNYAETKIEELKAKDSRYVAIAEAMLKFSELANFISAEYDNLADSDDFVSAFSEEYPFEESFDEIASRTIGWVQEFVDTCEGKTEEE